MNGSLQRVCKTFFIKTLDISDKTVRCALGKKSLGVFQGTDGRGKHIQQTRHPSILHYIELCPVVNCVGIG